MQSPSTRREWIEITTFERASGDSWSPSTRREWIEISGKYASEKFETVSLHTEGVD